MASIWKLGGFVATFNGTSGNDSLSGTDEADIINGLGGDDTLVGGLGADTLSGGAGNDTVRFNAVLSTNATLPMGGIDGGDGYDIVDASNVGPSYLLVAANGSPELVVGSQKFALSNIEEISLSDIGQISDLPGQILNLSGDLPGLKIVSGNGHDNVTISGSFDFSLRGGDDVLFLSDSFDGGGTGRIDGGSGIDTLSTSANFVVDLAAGTANAPDISYTISGFENVTLVTDGLSSEAYGDAGANALSASGMNDDGRAGLKMDGRGGNDTLTGSTGNDTLAGGTGHDNLFGLEGADTLTGGDGNDHLYGQSASGGDDSADSLNGGGGGDYLQGNAGNDTLDGGDGSDRIQGGRDNDTIQGGEGSDTVNGNLGNDTIDGGIGNDSLRGGQGNDSILGGTGNDILSGDLGTDTLTGGTGSDLFQFGGQASLVASPDRISDLTDGSDRLSVGYTPLAVLTGAAQSSLSAAATLAQQLFDGAVGNQEVAAIGVGADSYLFYSSNGGATADSAVLLAGVSASAITLADFG